MPEGPEVRLTTDYLAKTLEGKLITDWSFLPGQYATKDPEGFEQFYQHLPLMVNEVACKGKLIYISCFNQDHVFHIIHSMRMTGSWRHQPDAHTRWVVSLENGKKLWFRDPRRFATLQFTDDDQVLYQALAKLGPDIMTPAFTLPIWRQKLSAHSKKNVTAFLMDQSIFSGCGNYIKAEALYYAKILPTRDVGSLTETEVEQLFEALVVISRTSYVHKGLSLRDYADPNGKKGFQEFKLKIYGQPHAKRQKTSDGRTTYFDPTVQV